MKAVAQLNKDFARVDIVRAAEGEAVVEEHSAIGDVERLKAGGEPFAKTPA